MSHVFAYILHDNGAIDDSAAELAAVAAAIGTKTPTVALVCGYGAPLDSACDAASALFPEVWKISHENLARPNSELVRRALEKILLRGSVVLLPHNHSGIDLAPGLAIKLNAAYVPDVIEIKRIEGTDAELVRQEFGGQVNVRLRCDISSGAVITIRPGAFKPAAVSQARGAVVDQCSLVGDIAAKRRHLETIAAERGDVDIARYNVLIAVGRGIQEQDNIAMVQELADSIGAAVCCSRPVVDAKWMDKSRQVGSSGKTVRPKVYLACGISGSFQHLAGIKGNPCLVAINKNPKAPIFQVADVGVVDDLLEFLPELTRKLHATVK